MSNPKSHANPARRQLVCGGFALLVAAPALRLADAIGIGGRAGRDAEITVGSGCDGCDLIYQGMPERLTRATRIPAQAEPGLPLVVRGVIHRPDGRTPAAGVILYAYHTDAHGYYVPPDTTDRSLTRHGRLRGWMRTGPDGRYRFDTIRPAPYPGRDIPAHIHMVVKEPGKREYYIDDCEFDDDPLLDRARRQSREQRGGSGIVRVERAPDGIMQIERDIVLGRSVPNYR